VGFFEKSQVGFLGCFFYNNPGFHGTSGFHSWPSGVRPKQIEFAWDKIRNHSYSICGCNNINTWVIA